MFTTRVEAEGELGEGKVGTLISIVSLNWDESTTNQYGERENYHIRAYLSSIQHKNSASYGCGRFISNDLNYIVYVV